MAEPVPCLLLPGTLCDASLFEPILQVWRTLGFAPAHHMADLHQGPLDDGWCDAQMNATGTVMDVVGFSLGGILALQCLAQAPQRIRRMVLVATNPLPGSGVHRERFQQQWALWHQQGPQAVAEQMLAQASPNAPPYVLDCVKAMASATPTAALASQGELNASRPDRREQLARWSGPLMLVGGQDDPWCGTDKQQLLREVRPDAHGHLLPHTGHYVPLEQPEALGRLTCDFFSSEPNLYPSQDMP